MQNQNEEFNIIVHNDGKETRFKVKSLDSIRSLINKLDIDNPLKISKLIYKKLILCYAFSFAFYGIGEGSHIYAYTQQTEPHETENSKTSQLNNRFLPLLNKEQFKKAFERKYGNEYDQDEYENNYQIYKDQSLALEVGKLKDQFYQKIEGTLKCHRKFINEYFQNKEKPICSNSNQKLANDSTNNNMK